MVDHLDVQLLHALQIDGRAPFRLIGNVLGVSDQTVARRYNRLRSAGLLRVRGLLEPSRAGRTQWIVRIRCTPSTAGTVAESLALRPDTSWISLTAGGAEIVCVVSAASDTDAAGQPGALLERLPLSRNVLAVDAHCVLHEFFGGTASLIHKMGSLGPAQVAALRPTAGQRHTSAPARHLEPDDDRLIRALSDDGRATVTMLASTTGWSQSAVRRRIADLVGARLLYFDVDFDQSLLDLQMRAVMWLRVPADQLSSAGTTLAQHPEVGYVAATTGATNLYGAVSCPTPDALYTYLTERVAQLSAVQHLETAPIMRTVKSSGMLGTR